MAKQTLGYVELEWECPSCHTRNKGSAKTCVQCGAPHPEEAGYQQAAQDKILTDEAKIAEAKVGPDIYCAYCGAANPATRKTCKQCGSDLAEGKAAASGQVLGALRSEEAAPITCPACGASNPATAFKCGKCGNALRQAAPQRPMPAPQPAGAGKTLPLIFAAIAIIAVIAAVLLALGSRKTGVVGEVSNVNWRRTIAVEALLPVTLQAWADNIPSDAPVGRCWKAVYKVQDQPAPGAREVCGTPYVVDKGSGYGEVQRDCTYEIYADRCEYQSTAWRPIAPIVLEGSDLNPVWPNANLADNQRATGRSEDFRVTFNVDGKTYDYRPSRQEDFAQYSPGSQWQLKVNSFGSVSVEGPR
jgi:ribosomal protein L40E